jgi:hypothetical protein
MSRSLRTVLATAAAAGLLVGGVSLASYATTRHDSAGGAGAGASSEPKTLVFHLGSPGRQFAGDSAHFLGGKVPTGTYQVGMSGIVLDKASGGSDSYSCLVADKRDVKKVLAGTSASLRRIYALEGEGQGDFNFGVVASTNHVQKVDRSKIVVGCAFNGVGPFVVKRTLTFTFRPVKSTNKSAAPVDIVPEARVRKLSNLLR